MTSRQMAPIQFFYLISTMECASLNQTNNTRTQSDLDHYLRCFNSVWLPSLFCPSSLCVRAPSTLNQTMHCNLFVTSLFVYDFPVKFISNVFHIQAQTVVACTLLNFFNRLNFMAEKKKIRLQTDL